MPSKFTWFPKITRVVERIPSEDQRGTFALAVMRYGTEGAEPSLEYPLDALFESIREDVDNSVSAREGNAGGRPRKRRSDVQKDVREAEAESENQPEAESEAEKEQGSNESETPVSNIENGGLETSEPLLYKPSQDKPIQTRPEKEGGAREVPRADPRRGPSLRGGGRAEPRRGAVLRLLRVEGLDGRQGEDEGLEGRGPQLGAPRRGREGGGP